MVGIWMLGVTSLVKRMVTVLTRKWEHLHKQMHHRCINRGSPLTLLILAIRCTKNKPHLPVGVVLQAAEPLGRPKV